MIRSRFIAALGATSLAVPNIVRASTPASDVDPASISNAQELRVLLGHGEAQFVSLDRFTFNGRPYRGSFTVAPNGEIVNVVDLEAYLYSVVPREMSPSWPSAALEAQAICSRTYVLRRSDPRRDYDVVPSEVDQVYGGYASESPAARAAVDATHGFVLRYASGFAYSLYSSCCGGHTESSADAWNGPPFPYLMGVVCTYCTASPYYHWESDVAFGRVQTAFAAQLAELGPLTNARVGAIDASGRARTIELDTARGSTFVPGTRFRLSVGPRTVPSLLITKMGDMASSTSPAPSSLGNSLHIEGAGLGHGVGLCQWGARGLALRGANAMAILAYYFPGTSVGHD